MANIPSKIRFTDRDRDGAARYAIRMAQDEQVVYIMYYDYSTHEWCAERYLEFDGRINAAYEDKRYILPHGEITRLS